VKEKYPELDICIFKIPNVEFDDRFKSSALSAVANMLQACFGVVITSDVDEIVIPIDKGDSLKTLLLGLEDEFVAPIGMEPVQNSESEISFDNSKNVLSQRRVLFLTSGYTKPIIWKSSANFTPRLHGLDKPYTVNTELGLVHLRSVNIEECRKKQINRNSTEFSIDQEKIFGSCPWKKTVEDKAWYGNWIFAKASAVSKEKSIHLTKEKLDEFASDIEIKKYGNNYKHNVSVVTELMHSTIWPKG
jgi:hypothetical protein